jgi:glycosyltransferase involved in cell wall biosynthesis
MSHPALPIFFLTRPLHRERQRDTFAHLPPPFDAVGGSEVTDVPDHEVNPRRAASTSGRLALIARRAAINIGVARRAQVESCVLIYTWGKIPVWPRSPRFVVELDNPYVLALYGSIGPIRRWILRRALLGRRCAGIVCISEACRASASLLLGRDVAERARVVYPYVARGAQASPGKGSPLRTVFVGSQFWLKGGFELCDAFAEVAPELPEARLTVIGNVDRAVRERFGSTPIDFIEARLDRSEVAKWLREADLFAMPTLVESFGVAALEALAHGLPLLVTDVYALREMVEDGLNGVLVPDAFGYWRNGRSNPQIWRAPNLEAYARGRRFPELRASLVAQLRSLLSDRERLGAMGKASRALFDQRFAPAVRESSFRSALQTFIEASTG